MKRFLVGNSFPMNLVRRKVTITPETWQNCLHVLNAGSWKSFWGHQNTLSAVNDLCGLDLTPRTIRPALQLDKNGYPVLDGESFRECWLLSPEYTEGFRPAIGEEVGIEKIKAWQVLHITWV